MFERDLSSTIVADTYLGRYMITVRSVLIAMIGRIIPLITAHYGYPQCH